MINTRTLICMIDILLSKSQDSPGKRVLSGANRSERRGAVPSLPWMSKNNSQGKPPPTPAVGTQVHAIVVFVR